MPKKQNKPSAALWTTITILFSLALTGGTLYAFKSGLLTPKPQAPKKLVIKDAEAVPRFNKLMDEANAAAAKKDYAAAVAALDQILAIADANDRVKAACAEQGIAAQRDDLYVRLQKTAAPPK